MSACRYWDQQVSGGFHFNATATPTASAPGWTPRTWATPETGVVHMYHTARWGGWQFQLAARNDTDSSLAFACTLIKKDGKGGHVRDDATGLVPCPRDGSAAIVEGGWQEARGSSGGR